MSEDILELTYDPKLPLDIALAPQQLPEILDHYGLTQWDYDRLLEHTTFKRDLTRWRQEVGKEGFTLRLKALGLAEEHLPNMVALLSDADTPSATRVKVYELLLGMGGVATKAEATPSVPPGNAIQININLG